MVVYSREKGPRVSVTPVTHALSAGNTMAHPLALDARTAAMWPVLGGRQDPARAEQPARARRIHYCRAAGGALSKPPPGKRGMVFEVAHGHARPKREAAFDGARYYRLRGMGIAALSCAAPQGGSQTGKPTSLGIGDAP